ARHLVRGRRRQRSTVHVLHDDPVQRARPLSRPRRAERCRSVQRCADRRPDRRQDLRRRDGVPGRGRRRAGAAVVRARAVRRMSIEAALQALVDDDVSAWPDMPGRLLHVLAPSYGVDVEVTAGVADLSTSEALRQGSRFRIASVTKPFVGAAALRLVEDGELSLDGTFAQLLAGEYDDLLRGGGYETDAIMLRHLLTHTSGIYDFAADAYTDQIPDGFTAEVHKDPSSRWTRFEQIEFAVAHGTPYGAPGTVFGYSDTGACLVGEIIERVTGASMGAAIRALVGYERLGLTTTWQETIESEPDDLPQLSHQY